MKITPHPPKPSASLKPLLLTAILFAGCAANQPPERPAVSTTRHQTAERDDGSTLPTVGMTKAQVRARYGRPTNISTSTHGEMWMYVFNNFDGRDFIPFYGDIHARFKKSHGGSVMFDGGGRVKDFHWSETDPGGASIFR